jgi:DNA-directed RNA polymerase omega subunit
MDGRIPEKVDSKFRYVLVSARRAEQLIRGGRPRLNEAGKPTTVAMEEITRDLVDWDYGPAPQPEPAAAEATAAAAKEGAEAAEEVH